MNANSDSLSSIRTYHEELLVDSPKNLGQKGQNTTSFSRGGIDLGLTALESA
jgi:hypothetical protein